MESAIAQVEQSIELPAMQHDNDNNQSAKKYNGSRRPPQTADQRSKLLRKYDNALARVGRIEADAGPALQRDLGRSKRVQSAYRAGVERKRMTKRRLGHRSGLFRMMRSELGADPAATDRSRLYVAHMLMTSANVAALSGSGWPSVRTWLQSRIPAIMDAIGPAIETDFTTHLATAHAELAKRIPSGDPNLYTGPTPAEIAEALSLTDDQLRQANANRCGLTSIAPQDRRTRDRERKERERRKAGRNPQSERTAKADLQALADRLGCGIATIYRKRRDGTLDAFVAAHGQGDTEVSAVIREIDGGHFGITAPAPPDDDDWRDCFAYLGTILRVLHDELPRYQEQYPGLDLLAVLPALDAEIAAMADVESPEADSVLQEILQHRYGGMAVAAGSPRPVPGGPVASLRSHPTATRI